jgi:acetoin utilization protein AcuB
MLVRYFMTREVTTLPSTLSCVEAWRLFEQRGLRRAPVERDGQVVGMVTDRDLMRVLPWTVEGHSLDDSAERLRMSVGELPKRKLISVAPGDHLEVAARLMLEKKIGGLPVMQDGHLAGIITESDLFRIFVDMKERIGGERLTLQWPGGSSRMPDPTRLALACRVEIREHLTYVSPGGGELLSLRVRGGSTDDFVARLISSGFQLIDRELPSNVTR